MNHFAPFSHTIPRTHAVTYFPTTDQASFGGSAFAERFDEFQTDISFSPQRWKRREHIPDYIEVIRADLVVTRCSGPLRIEFPRGTQSIAAPTDGDRVDVGDLIAVGRHTYAVSSPVGQPFEAWLDLAVRRPTVQVSGTGGYVVPDDRMQYSLKLRLEDDRNAQRVGRFETWVKTLPDDPAGAESVESISLDGSWRIRHLRETSIEDLSVPWLNDSDWRDVEVPSCIEEEVDDVDGRYWFRRRVFVPDEWRRSAEPIRLRFGGADDEAFVFVNGYEVGYNGGWHRPFQFDVTDALNFGKENVIAVRVRIRAPRSIFHDGGITYAFVEPYAQNRYPRKTRPLGGLFESVVLSRDSSGGAVRWFPRFYPSLENELVVTIENQDGRPFSFGTDSSLVYAPPTMTYRRLIAGEHRIDVEAMAGYDFDEVYFTIHSCDESSGDEAPVVRVDGKPIAMNGRLVDGHRRVLALRREGSPDQSSTAAARHDEQQRTWEDRVYQVALPINLPPVEAAYVRTLKQTLSLIAKNVEGEIAGLFTDLIKYPIFWLRDAAISIPGTLYGGELAYKGAVAGAGEMYGRSRENPDYTILYPDGTMKPQQRADDAPPLAVYSIYKAWCFEGNEWLHRYYPTVVSYMDHLDQIERGYRNAPDGIIRNSDGDWWDYKYDPRYEREGAVFFVNVLYLRALKYGSVMARAMGDEAHADEWKRRFASGVRILNRPAEEGGLFLPDRGYFADAVTRLTDAHPNGYHFPTGHAGATDLDSLVVLGGFRPIPHAVAISEGLITDSKVVAGIVRLMETLHVLSPFPALVQYPWYDFMGNEGIGGEFETTLFAEKWKALPGNQASGGRWGFAAGLVAKALWSSGSTALGDMTFEAAANATTLARQPARVIEDAHSSGLFRNEAGSALDPEGFYYNWGAATPMEALVEGKYGMTPVPGGVRISPRRIKSGSGLRSCPIPNGSISLLWGNEGETTLSITTDTQVYVEVETPGGTATTVCDEVGRPVPLNPEEGTGNTYATFTTVAPGGTYTITRADGGKSPR